MKQTFLNLLQDAKKEILIIGILPIEEEIVGTKELPNGRIKEIVEKFHEEPNFKLSIYHESENDLFVNSLYLDTKHSKPRVSFKELKNKINRIERLEKSYLSEYAKNKEYEIDFENRLKIRQLNLKHSANIIKVDDKIYFSEVLLEIGSLDSYRQISDDDILRGKIDAYIDFITDEDVRDKGGIYLSKSGDELIEMYDKEDYPRGIFPRKAFYNNDFQRYSVWVFVFNRKGQMMLHQRTDKDKKIAKDNAGLWDKSAGGHVDLKDRSSNESAEREIIEEMYLADDEFTKYLKGDTTDFINLGEWLEETREGEKVMNLFERLKKDQWGYFSLKPCVKRVSKRRFVEVKPEYSKEKPKLNYSKTKKTYKETEYLSQTNNPKYRIYFRDTKFISDIFFFIAPDSEINDEKGLQNIPSKAAKARRLMDVRNFLDWIEDEKEKGESESIFTDDLIYIANQYKDVLLGFADNIKVYFKKQIENDQNIIECKY
jgi:isopentenyldiphosphate isomerase